MISDAQTQISDTDTGIQLTSLQYMDLENTILAATQGNRQSTYAVKLRDHEQIEYGRFSLIETANYNQHSLASDFDELVQLPLFEAWPIFPDSLLSTEIAVTTPCTSVGITHSADKNFVETHESESHGTTALYYKLHQPLPGYLGRQLYRSGTHVIALMSKETDLEFSGSSLTARLLGAFSQVGKKAKSSRDVLLSLFLESDGVKGGRLKNRLSTDLQAERYRLAHVCHRLNIIGKADLVLCDSSGVAVDAIRASVPAAFILDIPKGFERIHQCVVDFLAHGNQQQLINAQSQALDDILMEQSQHCHVISHQKSLHRLIHHRMAEADRQHARYDSKPVPEQKYLNPETCSSTYQTIQQDLILHSQQSLCIEPDTSVKLKSGLESSRRKFQKFRESPVRFMEDSQNRLLRSLVNTRT